MALNPQLSSPASPLVAKPFLGKQIPSSQKGEALHLEAASFLWKEVVVDSLLVKQQHL